LTLFGTSPATLFAHLGQLVSSSIEGCEYRYDPTGERSGVVTVTYPAARQIPARSFYTTVATFNLVLELCSIKGHVGLPRPRGPNSATYVVRW
jgi:hypothetical protein